MPPWSLVLILGLFSFRRNSSFLLRWDTGILVRAVPAFLDVSSIGRREWVLYDSFGYLIVA